MEVFHILISLKASISLKKSYPSPILPIDLTNVLIHNLYYVTSLLYQSYMCILLVKIKDHVLFNL